MTESLINFLNTVNQSCDLDSTRLNFDAEASSSSCNNMESMYTLYNDIKNKSDLSNESHIIFILTVLNLEDFSKFYQDTDFGRYMETCITDYIGLCLDNGDLINFVFMLNWLLEHDSKIHNHNSISNLNLDSILESNIDVFNVDNLIELENDSKLISKILKLNINFFDEAITSFSNSINSFPDTHSLYLKASKYSPIILHKSLLHRTNVRNLLQDILSRSLSLADSGTGSPEIKSFNFNFNKSILDLFENVDYLKSQITDNIGISKPKFSQVINDPNNSLYPKIVNDNYIYLGDSSTIPKWDSTEDFIQNFPVNIHLENGCQLIKPLSSIVDNHIVYDAKSNIFDDRFYDEHANISEDIILHTFIYYNIPFISNCSDQIKMNTLIDFNNLILSDSIFLKLNDFINLYLDNDIEIESLLEVSIPRFERFLRKISGSVKYRSDMTHKEAMMSDVISDLKSKSIINSDTYSLLNSLFLSEPINYRNRFAHGIPTLKCFHEYAFWFIIKVIFDLKDYLKNE